MQDTDAAKQGPDSAASPGQEHLKITRREDSVETTSAKVGFVYLLMHHRHQLTEESLRHTCSATDCLNDSARMLSHWNAFIQLCFRWTVTAVLLCK